VAAVASALPEPVAQEAVAALAAELWPELAGTRYLQVFDNAGIDWRRLVRPPAWYATPRPFAERQVLAHDICLELSVAAGQAVLASAEVRPRDVDALVFVSTTVLRAPNLDVDLVGRLGLPRDVRRLPLFGFASLGGAAGLALAADLVRAGYRTVLLVAGEVNSLTFVPGEPTPEAVVTLALFSDGAASAVVRAGDDPFGLVGEHTTLVPDSLDVMGFDPTETGLRWRLSSTVPDVARRETPHGVEEALASVGWGLGDLEHFLFHPGGVKVLDACAEALGIPGEHFARSREILARYGNLSSVTVLALLEHFLAEGPPPGRGLLTAMGPGFGYEHVLFEVPHLALP
jgi:alkylresorcinol/alkylpyrone synthase